jgi:hypothetical protein
VSALLGLVLAIAASLQDQQAPPTPAELEQEVLDNVLGQRLGDGTVADLALPEEFLRRVADRIVRSSFEERYRIVVKSAEDPAAKPATPSDPQRKPWIAVATGGLALLAIAWTAFARRRGRAAP